MLVFRGVKISLQILETARPSRTVSLSMVVQARLLALLCLPFAFSSISFAQSATGWLGDGASSAWSDPGNWTPAPPQSGAANTIRDLHFGAAFLASPTGTNFVSAGNDLADFRGHSLVFDSASTSPFFTITGNGFTLAESGGVSPSIIGNTITDVQTIDLTPGQVLRFDGGATGAAEISGRSFIDFKATSIELVGTTKLRVMGEGSIAIRGSLTGTGGLVVDSTRDVALSGAAKTFSGDTVVNKGRLVLSTALTASSITVNSGGELFAYRVNGVHAMMQKLTLTGGIFSGYDYQLDDLILASGSYHMRLAASNLGGVVGTVNLGSATKLVIDPNSESILNGVSLIENDGTDPVLGRFLDENGNVLGDGDVFASSQNGNRLFKISYTAGSGNDIWLFEVPEPGTACALLFCTGVLLSFRPRLRGRVELPG